MGVSNKTLRQLEESLNSSYVTNLVAQVDARHILEQTLEDKKNYPNFDKHLQEKITYLAYLEIMSGCSLLEVGNNPGKGREYLEKAGKIIGDAYLFEEDEDTSNMQLLIGGMALYAANQYSRSFVLLKKISGNNNVSEMIIAFLKKDLVALENISTRTFFSADEDDELIFEKELARIFLALICFIKLGKRASIEFLYKTIDLLIELMKLEFNSVNWLIARLLKIIISTFEAASLWNVLPQFVPMSDYLTDYIKNLAKQKNPVIELWPSQLNGIETLFANNGSAVINLKTSGGKTRVAEIAILDAIVRSGDGKILYIAPFKTLASEVEYSFGKVFGEMGIKVSNIYGGATASVDDIELIKNSGIVIATPEKIKAIYRADSAAFEKLSLVIFDEGHLISADKRELKNEVFDSHLISNCRENGTRIVVLSAVLPNASDISKWITGKEDAVAKSDWKPSLERPGFLIWNGEQVSLRWKSDVELFNNRFIVKEQYGHCKYPKNKNEAIAATAIKLSRTGPVMIYSAVAKSVEGLAKDVLKGYEYYNEKTLFEWDKVAWKEFEVICNEELEPTDTVIEAARYGIICHSNKLPTNVRIAIEKLMKTRKPNIIVASPTLAQGVNVGISTVIIATPYCYGEPITNRDFWNICGRAGRAYFDSEGKILYALDKTKPNKNVKKDFELGKKYFANKMEDVKSGLIQLVAETINVSNQLGLSPEQLLDVFAEDRLSDYDLLKSFEQYWNWVDDELLAIGYEKKSAEGFEDVVKSSLMYVQADDKKKALYSSLLKSRVIGIQKRINSVEKERMIVASGMEITVAEAILNDSDVFDSIANEYLLYEQEGDFLKLENGFRRLDSWIKENASSICEEMPSMEDLNQLRMNWISGKSIKDARTINKDVDKIVRNYYANAVPWLLNAASQMLEGDKDYKNIYSEMAMIIEYGVPSKETAYIYLAGIKSRTVATELVQKNLLIPDSIETAKNLLKNTEQYIFELSDKSQEYIYAFLKQNKKKKIREEVSIEPFREKHPGMPELLFLRECNDAIYLMSYDGYEIHRMKETDRMKNLVREKHSIYFEKVDGKYYLRRY